MAPPPPAQRLRNIEGHVRGLVRMLEEGEDVLDLITQAAGVKAAMDQVCIQLLEEHARAALREAMREDQEMGNEAAIDRLVKVFERFARS